MKETIKTILFAALIAVFIRTLIYEPFNIPSGSMLPNLLVGDYLFVNKFTYGYSTHSATYGLVPFEGRIGGSLPERGDVVVFKLPRDNRTDYIKRLIGLPGDRIQVRSGILFINDTPVRREYLETTALEEGRRLVNAKLYREYLPGGRTHTIVEESDAGELDNTPEFAVPPGHYFFMGDNRDNSMDSRTRLVGFVPLENMQGPATRLFLSVDDTYPLWQFWQWPWSIRFDRILMRVE